MLDYQDERFLADRGAVDMINDRNWWLDRAAEARAIGDLCHDAVAESIMWRLAEYYTELALACTR